MLKIRKEIRPNGTVALRIGGGRAIVLKTDAEAQAFLAGVKVAHIQLYNTIFPIISVGRSDGD